MATGMKRPSVRISSVTENTRDEFCQTILSLVMASEHALVCVQEASNVVVSGVDAALLTISGTRRCR